MPPCSLWTIAALGPGFQVITSGFSIRCKPGSLSTGRRRSWLDNFSQIHSILVATDGRWAEIVHCVGCIQNRDRSEVLTWSLCRQVAFLFPSWWPIAFFSSSNVVRYVNSFPRYRWCSWLRRWWLFLLYSSNSLERLHGACLQVGGSETDES